MGEALGDHHDLAALASELESRRDELGVGPELERMLELIARRRGELQSRAVAIGTGLYAEKTSAYGRRTGAHFQRSPQRGAATRA